MALSINRQVRLKSRPNGVLQAGNFEIAEAAAPDSADRNSW